MVEEFGPTELTADGSQLSAVGEPAEMAEALELRYVRLEALQLWDRNPKEHDLGALAASIEKHGYKNPAKFEPELNGGAGGIAAGNGRSTALRFMEAQGRPRPRGILMDEDGEWLVPVLFGVDAGSQAAAEAYGLDENNLGMLGGDFTALDVSKMYDQDSYLDLLDELFDADLEAAAPVSIHEEDARQIAEILRALPDEDVPPKTDQAEELVKLYGIQPGQIWCLGDDPEADAHLVACGDSQDPHTLAEIMRGQKARLVVTDPPYAVAYTDKAQRMARRGYFSENAPSNTGRIQGDELSHSDAVELWRGAFLAAFPVTVQNAAWYVWHGTGGGAGRLTDNLMHELGFWHHQNIIWSKNNFVIGLSDYHHKSETAWHGWRMPETVELDQAGFAESWDGEPAEEGMIGAEETAWYGWPKAHRPPFFGPRNQTTVWEVPRDSILFHPTQKPIPLYTRPIRNHTRERDIILDMFGGSGPAVIAALNMRRRARVVDNDPTAVALTVQRWADRTGREPRLLSG